MSNFLQSQRWVMRLMRGLGPAMLMGGLPFAVYGAQGAPTRMTLTLGVHTIEVEVAATPQQRERGLMGRAPLTQNQGMLFVFPSDAPRCLWMRDTPGALSAAFLDASGQILNVVEMHPLTDTRHCSTAPARYALEAGAGWFRERRLSAGRHVRGLESMPAAVR